MKPWYCGAKFQIGEDCTSRDPLTNKCKGIFPRCQHRLSEQNIARFADLAREKSALENRLNHLLESEYIRQFDEKDPETGEYKRDIKGADATAALCGKLKSLMPAFMECLERGMINND